MIRAVLAAGDKSIAYVALRLAGPLWFVAFDGSEYRYTSERTEGGWWVYQRVG